MRGAGAAPGLLPLVVLTSALAACGGRTPLLSGAGESGPAGGAGGVGGGGGVAPKTCSSWVATHAPVQISNIPSIVELQAATATSAGVVVGYADAQLPPVDASWHTRLVGYGDAALGPEETPFARGPSSLGWTRISVAVAYGNAGAMASDDARGAQFVTLDAQGAPVAGSIQALDGVAARFLFATPNGFSVLRSTFDDTGTMPGPVFLEALDRIGQITATQSEVEPSASDIEWYSRVGLGDASFLFLWMGTEPCAGCRTVNAQHLSQTGQVLAPATVLQAFGANDSGDFVLAAGSNGLLLVTSSGDSPSADLSATPVDTDGQPTAASTRFATLPNGNGPALAVAAAPGGDFLVAAIDGVNTGSGQLYVQAVAADGSSEGPATTVTTVAAPQLDEGLMVVATDAGAMVLYESDVPMYGIEVYAVPLACKL